MAYGTEGKKEKVYQDAHQTTINACSVAMY